MTRAEYFEAVGRADGIAKSEAIGEAKLSEKGYTMFVLVNPFSFVLFICDLDGILPLKTHLHF